MNATIALAIVSLRGSYSRMAGAVIAQVRFAGRQTEPITPILVNLMVAIGLGGIVYVIAVAHQLSSGDRTPNRHDSAKTRLRRTT